MNATMQIRVRVPARRMKKVQTLFAEMGTDVTSAINIFLAQVERSKRIPFDVAADKIPNAVTRAAMHEADELASRSAYTNKKDFFTALKSRK